MSKKLFLFVSLLVVATMVLTACGPAQVVKDARKTATAMANNAEATKIVAEAQALLNGTPTPAPMVIPATPTLAPAQPAGSCPQARDLGPWAPSAPGKGETFEVTASDQGASNLSSSGVVLGLWFPAGNTAWGTKEITTFVPRGMSITVINGAGRGWDYEATCDSAEVTRQMEAHMTARKNDTSYFDFVSLDDLISAGLVEVRFDRSSNPIP